MPDFNVQIDGADLRIELSALTGMERVFFDGALVSEKRSFLYLTVHAFNVQTGGRTDVYEVNVITGMAQYGYVVRRNGIVIAHEP